MQYDSWIILSYIKYDKRNNFTSNWLYISAIKFGKIVVLLGLYLKRKIDTTLAQSWMKKTNHRTLEILEILKESIYQSESNKKNKK